MDPYRLPIPMLWKTRRTTDKMARNLWTVYILSIPLKSFSKTRDRVANIKVHDKVVKARPGATKFVMPLASQAYTVRTILTVSRRIPLYDFM